MSVATSGDRSGRGRPPLARDERPAARAAVRAAVAALLLGVALVAVPLVAAGAPPVGTGTGTWLETATVGSRSTTLVDVSCASPRFCMAISDASDSYEWTGSSWAEHPIPGGFSPGLVSCPVAGRCVAVALQGYATTFSSGAWSPATRFDPAPSPAVSGLACSTPTRCVAVDDSSGTALAFDGRTWGAPVAIDPAAAAAARAVAAGRYDAGISMTVSCPPRGASCVELDSAGHTAVLTGSRWARERSRARGLRSPSDPVDLSCPSARTCIAGGSTAPGAPAAFWTWDGSSWSGPESGGGALAVPGISRLSCPTARFCGGFLGARWAVYDGASWLQSAGAAAVPGGEVSGLSCPTVTFCMAVGSFGDAALWHP